jgi:phasin
MSTTNNKTTKTAKASAKTAATVPFEAFSFPTQPFEVPDAFREMAEKSVSQARDTYSRMKTAAEDATDLVEGTMETARQGTFAIGAKALDAARSNTDASFAFARELMGAKTMAEVVELQTSFARQQFEAVASQFKEIQALSEKLFTDTTKPVTAKAEKTMKELKVA